MLHTVLGLLKADLGWVVAVVAVLLLIVRDAVKAWLTKLLEALGALLYRKLAGSRLLRWTAIRRYRRALIRKHSRVDVAFLTDRTLNMADIYVPLRVAGTGRESAQVEAQDALASQRRLMVTGAPGSGKSMLLRNWLFGWARGDQS